MDDRQEQQIARGLREGAVDAWGALYNAYCERIWRSVARLMGPDSADVADVVQESFLAAARSARTYDPDQGSLWGWLYGIARNHVALHYRKQQRQDRIKRAGEWLASSDGQLLRWLQNCDQGPAEKLENKEVATLVRAALTELPDDYELLLTEKYLDEATVNEIAGRQNVSETAIRSKLARARRAFRDAFLKVSGGSH